MPRGTTSHARSIIKAEELLKKLQGFALGEIDPKTGEPIQLTQRQVSAYKICLAKAIPDLKAVELTGEDGKPITAAVKVLFVDAPDKK